MKIALLQCNTSAGDIEGNTEKIVAAVRKATADGVNLCITSELAISGVGLKNILEAPFFLERCQEALVSIAEIFKDGPSIIIGSPVHRVLDAEKKAASAAILLQDGKVKVISRKIFCGLGENISYFECGFSCGLITIAGWRFGIVLCEDVWGENSFWKRPHTNTHNPLMELVMRGVDAIIHLGASSFFIDDITQRKSILAHVAARHHIHLFSSNLIGGNDNIVYHGNSLIIDSTGMLIRQGKFFEEDIVIHNMGSTAINSVAEYVDIVNEEFCWKALVLGTKDFVQKSGFKKVIIGLSGGIDSALVATIARDALGAENVLAVLMPSPYTSEQSGIDAMELAKRLGIKTHTVPIAAAMQVYENILNPILNMYSEKNEIPSVTYENIQSRIRGSILMALSNAINALVLNAGNKSEIAMGYCTLYGDSVGALAVIGDVSKTDVYNLANWYNMHNKEEIIPLAIIERAPTAELRPNQLDTDSLPPYNELDPIVEALLRGSSEHQNNVADDIEKERKSALGIDICNKIIHAEYKRKQLPMALRLSKKTFGIGWKVPVVSKYNIF